jgi:GTP cyclohydrolase II
MTGDLLGSLRCDCGEQLQEAMRRFANKGRGVLIYLRQEGRNIGLLNKMRAYALQNEGADTADANLTLGFAVDERDYSSAGLILKDLGVQSVIPHTDNPKKIQALRDAGVKTEARSALSVTPNENNRAYLDTKYTKIGHLREEN